MRTPKKKSALEREVDAGYARFCAKRGLPLPKKWSKKPSSTKGAKP